MSLTHFRNVPAAAISSTAHFNSQLPFLHASLMAITHLTEENLQNLCKLADETMHNYLAQTEQTVSPEILQKLSAVKSELLPELVSGIAQDGLDPCVIEFSIIRKELRECLPGNTRLQPQAQPLQAKAG